MKMQFYVVHITHENEIFKWDIFYYIMLNGFPGFI